MVFAVLLQWFHPEMLAMVAVLLLVAVLVNAPHNFLRLLRRTRWIMFALMMIYALMTPGVAVFPQWASYSPTLEGLQEGLVQLGRLVCMLASLSILLARMTRQDMVGGIFVLAGWLFIPRALRQRMAVRLALTLEYAEDAMRGPVTDWHASLANFDTQAVPEARELQMSLPRFTLIDTLLVVASSCLLLILVMP